MEIKTQVDFARLSVAYQGWWRTFCSSPCCTASGLWSSHSEEYLTDSEAEQGRQEKVQVISCTSPQYPHTHWHTSTKERWCKHLFPRAWSKPLFSEVQKYLGCISRPLISGECSWWLPLWLCALHFLYLLSLVLNSYLIFGMNPTNSFIGMLKAILLVFSHWNFKYYFIDTAL